MNPIPTRAFSHLFVRRSRTFALAAFLLCISHWTFAQPAPTDACSFGAGSRYTVNTSCVNQTFDKPGSFVNNINPGTCSGDNSGDGFGWFQATATSTTITYTPDTRDAIMHLYSGTCASLTYLTCINANGAGQSETITWATTIGVNYLVRIQRNGSSSNMTGDLCVWSAPPPPSNDDPCAAVPLTPGTTCTNTAGTNVSATATAGIPAPGCAGYSGGDVWYSFTAPASGTVDIQTTANGMTDSGMALYSATACGGTFSLISCDNNGGTGSMSRIQQNGLTPGQTYYVRMWGNGGATGTFSICVVTPAAPTNDDPCGAVALTVGSSCSNTAGTNYGASQTSGIPAPGCGNYTNGDVWYTFVVPAGGSVAVSTSANGLTDSGIALYTATACAGTFTLVSCSGNGNGNMGQITSTGLTVGATYYVRVWGENGATGTFNICAYVPLVNDDPCGAISLTLGTTCSYTTYNNSAATASSGTIPAPGCGNYSSGDVWFSFVAPSTGLVTIRTSAGTLTNMAMAVYSATACNGTFTLISCDDNNGPNNTSFLTLTPLELVAGQTYYLRVWGSGGSVGTFGLCANTAPSGGTCVYVLRMYDSQGDGWGSSNVSIQVGAGAAVAYTNASSDADMAYISVNSGQIVQLTYNTGGSGNQGEISYVLQLAYGSLYQDGPTPGTGLRYAAAATCVSPSASTSDCYGNTAVCGSQQISATPNNTGLAADLNVNNRGCLGSSERQGLWYSFTPSAGGTLAMTISPSVNTNDYDFAIWGPYTSLSCPIGNVPLRCNYSGNTGNTGLSTTATNPSEGAGGSQWSTAMTVSVGEYYLLYISNFSQSGLSFNLTWQLTNGASLGCQLLPIEMASFNGQAQDNSVLLDWVTGSEAGSDHFEVQRSTDGSDFSLIGSVDAAHNSMTATSYSFVDGSPKVGVNYYRLNSVDADGSSTLSQIVAVAFKGTLSVGSAYPDPATDQINLDLSSALEQDVNVTIRDASGRAVSARNLHVAAGAQRFTSEVGSLGSGFYHVVITTASGEVLHSGRFVKD
ncbi:MAG TPA: T9SS type A sorting domain-containing protein [Flavobacteriales bacterium]|nr:T9SS type A sorting domain-containing protein [Flavobacteriales bacterium]